MKNVRKRILLASMLISSTVAITQVTVTSPASASAESKITTWISGLNAPRGLAFDDDGSLYVSESGLSGTGPAGLTRTGAVTKYGRKSTNAMWRSSFESAYLTIDPSQPPDVLGPEGISAVGKNCSRSSEERGRDGRAKACEIRVILSESHAGILKESGGVLSTTQIGHLFSLNGSTGVAADVSNVGDQQYQWTTDHQALFDSDFPDSNPFGVLVTRDEDSERVRTFVADAGANTISEVLGDGSTRVIAFIPNETAPPFRDATPTCIAQGPDGMLYVATLNFVSNLFVNGPGQSNVWKVDPNANFPTVPTIWATGLTTPTSCTFDHDGNFWATEMFQPNVGAAPGDIVRIPFRRPTRVERFGGGSLPLPGGIAEGPDEGSMYVSVNSSSPVPQSGAIMKVKFNE